MAEILLFLIFTMDNMGSIAICTGHAICTGFAYAKTKAQISCAVTAQLIDALVFATRIVNSFSS